MHSSAAHGRRAPDARCGRGAYGARCRAPVALAHAGAVLRPFRQVDVFTTTPYTGNALAVVLDGDGLSADEMQRFASWTNLSETTFVLPPTAPGADYRVRTFTPAAELPFAGHPTLGTCHAWLSLRGPAGPTGSVAVAILLDDRSCVMTPTWGARRSGSSMARDRLAAGPLKLAETRSAADPPSQQPHR
jgi:predicted PhzF superfamily epimerase YddE/YHI9